MRKLLFLFTAALIITSCDALKKKSKDKETDDTEETTTKKKKSDDDMTPDDTKKDDDTKNKKNTVEDDNFQPKGKKDNTDNDNTNNTTKNNNDRNNDDVVNTRNNTSDLKTWNWSTYKVQFKAPSDFSIDENSGSKWDGGNGKLHLSIYPKKGEEIERSELKSLLGSWAKQTNLSYSGDAQTMSNLNGYWGVYIDGKGSNGLPTSILLLVDPDDPSISFYIWLQYQSGYLDTAVDILKSFKPS